MDTIGGFPQALAVDYSSIPEEFLCPVCHDICKIPVATTCHHIFCRSCLDGSVERKRVCPCCRANLREGELPSLSQNNPVLNRMYGRIQMKCMLHTKGCTWTGNIVDLNTHMNSCVHNVDAILKRAEVAEAKVKALEAQIEAQREEAAAKVKALEAQIEAQRKKAAAEMKAQVEEHRLSIDTKHRNISGYQFLDRFSMETIANKIAQCARVQESPVGGWKSVYAVLKEAHSDWVEKYTNEPDGFHWYYGYLLSTAYLSGADFQKNQRDNINKWLWSYWRWVTDDYGDRA